ncbi:cuticle protein 19.8-like [Penaeus chinensis]|uniref:cuticle protein 19.8-like n=1 Tax=Penaeus chinensis TaxID=139456 RepID=UPI001FB5814A|nr:cuticle protein 19.8-like [Penaeus chinensis]
MLLSHARSQSWTLPSYRIHGPPRDVEYVRNAPHTQYQYFYQVRDDTSGVDFGHQESRKGHQTQGSYHVRLPDGRLQRVAYTVTGDSGFRARVFYEDAAKYHSSETGVNTVTSSYDLIPSLS